MEKYSLLRITAFEKDVGRDVLYPAPEDVAEMWAAVPTDGGPVPGWPQLYDTVAVDHLPYDHYVMGNSSHTFEWGPQSAFVSDRSCSHHIVDEGQPPARKRTTSGKSVDRTTQAPVSRKSSSKCRVGRVPQDRGGGGDDDLRAEANEKLRRRRNREATKKSHRKKKRHMEEMERQEMELTLQWDHLQAEVDSLQAEVLTLKHEILRHRDCGSDIIDGYIAASAKELVNANGRIHRTRFGNGYGMGVCPQTG